MYLSYFSTGTEALHRSGEFPNVSGHFSTRMAVSWPAERRAEIDHLKSHPD
jgi:hypothetical protein